MSHYVLDARTATAHFPGIGRYVKNLAEALFDVLDTGELFSLISPPGGGDGPFKRIKSAQVVQNFHSNITPFMISQQWEIPRLLRTIGTQVYHSPFYLTPYFPGVPMVLTVYDLIPLIFPEHVSLRARIFFRWSTQLALRSSDRVIAISNTTKQDYLTTFRISPEKIVVIPLAPDPIFHPQSSEKIEQIVEAYSLPDRFALYLGINKPHKNLVRLIRAWSQVVENLGRDYILVVAGAWDERYPEPLLVTNQLGIEKNVFFLGPIPDHELPALYSSASLFVYPSLYEGFGLPVMEAMACGIPVTCSRTPGLTEVAEEAALLFDPNSVDAIANALIKLLTDLDHQRYFGEKGLSQIKKFSWDRVARDTRHVYHHVMGRK